jgi:hypothetical protein
VYVYVYVYVYAYVYVHVHVREHICVCLECSERACTRDVGCLSLLSHLCVCGHDDVISAAT